MANGFRPRACPECGGKNTPSAWAILVPSILFPVLFLAPLLIVRPTAPAMFWYLVVAGFAVAAIGCTLAYLCVPLLRHGTRFARFEWLSFVAAVAGVMLCALLKPEPSLFSLPELPRLTLGNTTQRVGATGRHFSSPETQQEWKDALKEAGIPYTLGQSEGREFVYVAAEYAEAVKKVEADLWGIPLIPGKRNVGFGDAKITEEFRAWLTARGIPFTVHGTKKHPITAWDGPDNLTVEFMKSRIVGDCGNVAAAPSPAKRC